MLQKRSGLLARGASLLSAGAAGAAVALVGAWLLGGFHQGTSTVREVVAAPPDTAPANVAATGGALTIGEIYKKDSPGVVQITARILTQPQNPLFGSPFGFPQVEKALGSGFVLDKLGHIVTNYHVIAGARSIRVSFSNSDSMKARVVGADPSTDIAVLKVSAKSRALSPLALGNSDGVAVGDAVVALGNPFGFSRTVTAGIVSALQREIQSPNSQPIDHVIQTDAAINPGNSGGPLLDSEGRVVGVNAQISTGNTGERGNVGIGFAIPINTVKDVAAQLIRSGHVEHPFLGVDVRGFSASFARLFRLPVSHGLLVQRVYSNSAAAKAGLKAGTIDVVVAGESYVVGGDVIVGVDGIPVFSIARLRDILSARKPGDTISVELYRAGAKQTVNVKLGRQPATTPPSPG
jgi:S1-C subfamily serine protease